MGQYYNALLIRNDKKKVIDDIKDVLRGYKLTEHSWWRNPFVNTVCHEILKKPTKVYWVGDYANEEDFEFYEEVWGKNNIAKKVTEAQVPLDDNFLVNHTQKVYIDCNNYYKQSKDNHGWVMHPLPLLTAVGNGRGGGDYYDGNSDAYLVGTWAGDEISVEYSIDKFKGFEPFEVVFKEDW